MRNKDQILLEDLYNQIGNEETQTSNNSSFEDNTESNVKESESSDSIYAMIASEFGERAHPSDKVFEYLNQIKETGSISGLISYLNEIEEWDFKDKLMEFLFQYYTQN